jgi:single-stranded DNA-binding protein
MEVQGKLEKFLPIQKGTKKDGGEWQKQSFLVKTTEEYNNLYCFEVFGDEKVENLTKYQKEGDQVKVVFNVQTNEWKDKYFTSLSAWRIEKISGETTATETEEEGDGLPF